MFRIKKSFVTSKAKSDKENTVADPAAKEGRDAFFSGDEVSGDKYNQLEKFSKFSKYGRFLIELSYFFWDSETQFRHKITVIVFILLIAVFTLLALYLFSGGAGSVTNYYGNNAPVYHGQPQHDLPEPSTETNAVPPTIENNSTGQNLTPPSVRGHLSSFH